LDCTENGELTVGVITVPFICIRLYPVKRCGDNTNGREKFFYDLGFRFVFGFYVYNGMRLMCQPRGVGDSFLLLYP